jgi:hypothetical protein
MSASKSKYEDEDSDNEFVLHEDDPEYAQQEAKKKSTLSVEKILGRKVVTPSGAAVNGNTNNTDPSTNTELFYIKWKGSICYQITP